MSGSWKQKERLVAEWWGSVRNPLSGRNNVDDSGNRRLGDVVTDVAVVEVKRRKSNSIIKRASITCDLATGHNLPWVHIEFSTRIPDKAALVADYDTVKFLLSVLKSKWTKAL